MPIHAIKTFLKVNIHCSKYQIFRGQTMGKLWTMSVSYGQWVKDIGVGVSYSDEGLGMTMLKTSLYQGVQGKALVKPVGM